MLLPLNDMHEIEPFFHWRHLYTAEEDKRSPFFGRTYSEFIFSQTIYNFYIHPQWDDFGSKTLYLKILFVDYDARFAIIELLGEWNDAIENDIMELKREILDRLYKAGIYHYIIIAENVLNFHSSDKEYYQEWFDELTEENGWAIALNMSEASAQEFCKKKLHYFIELMMIENWRQFKPEDLFSLINQRIQSRLAGI